jgi:hypothetical protein
MLLPSRSLSSKMTVSPPAAEVARLHAADLLSKYSFDGLDIDETRAVRAGLGRIVASRHRSSASYQTR